MTKVSYEFTDNVGRVTTVASYAQAEALKAQKGGKYKAVYTPIKEKGVDFSKYSPERQEILNVYGFYPNPAKV